MAAAYSYPWYAGWSLPTFTDRQPSQLAWVVWLQASLMLAALKLPVRPSGTVVGILTRGVLSYVAPLVLLAAFVVIGLRGATEPRAAAQSIHRAVISWSGAGAGRATGARSV
jgi:hypothetical protein